MDLWSQLKQQVESGFESLKEQGLPAIKAGLENQAQDWLNKQKAETQATINANVNKMLNNPGEPSPFMAGIRDAFKGPVMQQYGPMIGLGVVALVIVGVVIARK